MKTIYLLLLLVLFASCTSKPIRRNPSLDRLLRRSERFYNCLTGLNREGFKQSYIELMCKRMIDVD